MGSPRSGNSGLNGVEDTKEDRTKRRKTADDNYHVYFEAAEE